MLMPVVPLMEEGTLTVTITAYGPIKADTEVINIDVEVLIIHFNICFDILYEQNRKMNMKLILEVLYGKRL